MCDVFADEPGNGADTREPYASYMLRLAGVKARAAWLGWARPPRAEFVRVSVIDGPIHRLWRYTQRGGALPDALVKRASDFNAHWVSRSARGWHLPQRQQFLAPL